MNQTWKMVKNLISGIIFCRFYLYQMLDIAAICHCIQVQEKLMIKTQNYGKKPHFVYDLSLNTMVIYHHGRY